MSDASCACHIIMQQQISQIFQKLYTPDWKKWLPCIGDKWKGYYLSNVWIHVLTFYYQSLYGTPNKSAVTYAKGATGRTRLLVITKIGGVLHKIKVFTYYSDTIFTKCSVCSILVTNSIITCRMQLAPSWQQWTTQPHLLGLHCHGIREENCPEKH
jgi:hypothetical protein